SSVPNWLQSPTSQTGEDNHLLSGTFALIIAKYIYYQGYFALIIGKISYYQGTFALIIAKNLYYQGKLS
ncbi:hypothetical protein MHK_006502, partial [Candidatus Magnetomorum sp. HK-1]